MVFLLSKPWASGIGWSKFNYIGANMNNISKKTFLYFITFFSISISSAYAEEINKENSLIFCAGISDGSSNDGEADKWDWLRDEDGEIIQVEGNWHLKSTPSIKYYFEWTWAFQVEPAEFDRVNDLCTSKYGDLSAAQPAANRNSRSWYRLVTTDRVYYKFSSRYYKVKYKKAGVGIQFFGEKSFYQKDDSPFQWISNPSAYW